jgi:hypothetical protein
MHAAVVDEQRTRPSDAAAVHRSMSVFPPLTCVCSVVGSAERTGRQRSNSSSGTGQWQQWQRQRRQWRRLRGDVDSVQQIVRSTLPLCRGRQRAANSRACLFWGDAERSNLALALPRFGLPLQTSCASNKKGAPQSKCIQR